MRNEKIYWNFRQSAKSPLENDSCESINIFLSGIETRGDSELGTWNYKKGEHAAPLLLMRKLLKNYFLIFYHFTDVDQCISHSSQCRINAHSS